MLPMGAQYAGDDYFDIESRRVDLRKALKGLRRNNDQEKDIVIRLNEYQRRNLLFLLNSCGYPCDNKFIRPELAPFNTGDWLGEVVIALSKPEEHLIGPGPSDGCKPILPKDLDACCENEDREWAGGCRNCGDPAF